jgi:hypothetical protein
MFLVEKELGYGAWCMEFVWDKERYPMIPVVSNLGSGAV